MLRNRQSLLEKDYRYGNSSVRGDIDRFVFPSILNPSIIRQHIQFMRKINASYWLNFAIICNKVNEYRSASKLFALTSRLNNLKIRWYRVVNFCYKSFDACELWKCKIVKFLRRFFRDLWAAVQGALPQVGKLENFGLRDGAT